PDEEKFLMSPQRPIILLRRKPESTIAHSVAPSNKYLGVMVPYTPLHYVILAESRMVLVMTSGNITEEPIAMENEEGLRRLGYIADYFLLHNRDIYSRYDDSVARVFDGELMMLRRARSFAPFPIHLPFKSQPILATGPELKNTFCLTKDNYAFVSQHIGDMENLETEEHFKTTLELYRRLFRIDPKIVAYDLHPEYLSTKYAKSLENVELVGVQHHFAHTVSCMVENGVKDKVIGISFDGLGYGTDGAIWGGEVLVADWKNFRRAAHLRYVPMPGGAAAIKKPYRMAFGYLYSFFGDGYKNFDLEYLENLNEVEERIMKQQIDKGINSPLTSSCGRLFDAVSSLCRVRDEVFYEGEAAIDLEMLADEDEKGSYPFDIKPGNESLVIDTKPVIEAVVKDLQDKVDVSTISAKFHNTVVEIICRICEQIRDSEEINRVALGGGVFQNFFLFTRALKKLRGNGFEVYYHKKVPANDGGISLGQVVVANESVKDTNNENFV
ncbi:MAG: carbamoyltransferase HypF, partial [Candidatus Zixiibacteriota bacterium]